MEEIRPAPKPPFRAGIDLQNRCLERKSQETNPTHHELQPKWEIPVNMSPTPANLVIRLTMLGDLINTTPVYRAFKETFTNQPLHLLTGDVVSSIIDHDPYVDKIIRIPWRDRYRGMRPSWPSIYSTVKANGPYERAAVLESGVGGFNWALALLGVKQIAQIGGTISSLLLRHAYVLRGNHKGGEHISEQLLAVAGKLGATTADPFPRLYVTEEERAAVLLKFPSLLEPNKILVHFFCHTSVANLSPLAYFELCRQLADRSPYRFYIVGTEKEMQRIDFPSHPKISSELAGGNHSPRTDGNLHSYRPCDGWIKRDYSSGRRHASRNSRVLLPRQ